MRVAVIGLLVVLSACSGKPSASAAQEIMQSNIHENVKIAVHEMKCTEQENEAYSCFLSYSSTLPNGQKVDFTIDDASFRKVNGEWQSDVLSRDPQLVN